VGSDAFVYIFDYQHYVNSIVPTFRHLLLTGEFPTDWRALVWSDIENDLISLRGTDMEHNCGYLTSDLSYVSGWVDEKRSGDCFAPWEVRACRSQSCLDRTTCPLHINSPERVSESLLDLFARATGATCASAGRFVGRTTRVSDYDKLLDRYGFSVEHAGRQLLELLGLRGFVIGYQWAGSCEGIHGWLDPDETHVLYEFLAHLPLPHYYRQMLEGALSEDETTTHYNEHSFEEFSLGQVFIQAAHASREGKGLLWGNDIWGREDRAGLEALCVEMNGGPQAP